MKVSKNLKFLTSGKVIFVFLLDTLLIICTFLFFGWLLNELKPPSKGYFSYRETALCLGLSLLLSGVFTYLLLIRQLWNIEEFITKHASVFDAAKADNAGDIFSSPTIDTTLYHLIRQQEFANAQKRFEEKQRKKAELYALSSQIDPHFLYNALDSIRGYALIHDMEEISDITEALSRVFRNMISDKQELLSFRQEMDNINNYMKVQQFRFNNKFDYSFDVEEELPDKYMIPRMVLQPLVENAITHGLEHKIEGGRIQILAYTTEHKFILAVTDNGAGISEERLEFLENAMHIAYSDYSHATGTDTHAGIALININRRIKLTFGNEYGISLSSTPNIRTTSEVTFPLLLCRQ